MLKKILNLNGAQELSKKQQHSIKGGIISCTTDSECQPYFCGKSVCVPGHNICLGELYSGGRPCP